MTVGRSPGASGSPDGARGSGAIEGHLLDTGRPVRVRYDAGTIVGLDDVSTAPPRWLAPGLIDIQINGYAGHDLNIGAGVAANTRALARELWKSGVTGILATVGTESEAHIIECLAGIAEARREDAAAAHAIIGIHVEGPYLSVEDGPRGAHALEHVRDPDIDEYRRWQKAAGGAIRLVTIAPERPGAIEYIAALTADGVVVSIGHTAATPAQIRAAVDAGAALSTHLGNGAHAVLPRHPNYIWEQLAEDRLSASFVFDGHHLPTSFMKAAVRAKGIGRTVLVSDAVALGGLAPGRYPRRETVLELREDGRLGMAGTPFLAGSTATLAECVGIAVGRTALTLPEAVMAATLNPARLLGIAPMRGTLALGAAADVTAFTMDPYTCHVTIEETVTLGSTVFPAPA